MGVARRLAKRAAVAGLVLIGLTVAAVTHATDRNVRLYGDGRGLEAPVDAIIVLGAGVDGDGMAGYSSRRRVALAVKLLAEGKARNLILSGGPAIRGSALILADLMRDYAIQLGAPPEALLIETRSVSTFENLRFSLPLAEARGLDRLAILTDDYHLERARWLAAYLGRPDIGLVAARAWPHADRFEQVAGTIREALAWWYNLAKVAGWEALGVAGVGPETRREWIR